MSNGQDTATAEGSCHIPTTGWQIRGSNTLQDNQLSTISNFIWNTADSLLRDLYVRGKYRDVILPMTVIRRLDAVLEDTKPAVLEQKKWLDEANIIDQVGPLTQAAGQQFYNASQFTLRDLTTATAQQQLRQNFEAYLVLQRRIAQEDS